LRAALAGGRAARRAPHGAPDLRHRERVCRGRRRGDRGPAPPRRPPLGRVRGADAGRGADPPRRVDGPHLQGSPAGRAPPRRRRAPPRRPRAPRALDAPGSGAGGCAARGGIGAAAMIRDLFILTKPRISLLSVATAAVGLALAPGRPRRGRAALALAGTWPLVGSPHTVH